jgi:hypothetical protein
VGLERNKKIDAMNNTIMTKTVLLSLLLLLLTFSCGGDTHPLLSLLGRIHSNFNGFACISEKFNVYLTH